MQEKVSIITVTYGKRENYLLEILSSLNKNKYIENFIIVNNAGEVENIFSKDYSFNVKVINLSENTGSANGYKVGLEYAMQCEPNYLFMIDDDNLPDEECVEKLLHKYKEVMEKDSAELFSLLALREDRLDFNKIANGVNSRKVFTFNNSFLGWHLKDIPRKIMKKFPSINKQKSKTNEIFKVPLAPYGGLMVNKKIINEIGLPNTNFYLYCDDYEFTYRITKNKGNIYLVPDCKIKDIDKSWFVKENYGFIKSFLKSKQSFRIYYGIRNRVFFEKENFISNKIVYKVNMYAFLTLLYITAILTNETERFNLIRKAIRDGNNGDLGIYNEKQV
jgi:GT2 family glycosyltransferase